MGHLSKTWSLDPPARRCRKWRRDTADLTIGAEVAREAPRLPALQITTSRLNAGHSDTVAKTLHIYGPVHTVRVRLGLVHLHAANDAGFDHTLVLR